MRLNRDALPDWRGEAPTNYRHIRESFALAMQDHLEPEAIRGIVQTVDDAVVNNESSLAWEGEHESMNCETGDTQSEGSMHEEVQAAIRVERSKWEEPDMVEDEPDVVSEIEREEELDVPEVVNSPGAINDGWCRVFAERVYERLGRPESVSVESDGVTHTWLEHGGLCYDASCTEGVPHPSMLPVYTGE